MTPKAGAQAVDDKGATSDPATTLSNIFLLLGFMPLNRVNTIEALRRHPPGEWGKVLGLDRCPVVETLREKIKLITRSHEAVENWAAELSRDWMEAESRKPKA